MTEASKHSAAATASPARGIEPQATPLAPSEAAEAFYATALQELADLGLPFLVGGTYAVCAYTGIQRPTKDLDILCKAGDFRKHAA